jgi:ribosomal protein S18 acetylase RimI-like enzyme
MTASEASRSFPLQRPVTLGDDGFLFTLYASTRAHELATWGWGPAQQELFLRMQYQAQVRHYAATYPPEGHVILEQEGLPVGRLWVVRASTELFLVDIALLASHRGMGLGTHLLRTLQDEAARAGLPVRLNVTRDNPARRLYTRLGFTPMPGSSDAAPYLELRWHPAP